MCVYVFNCIYIHIHAYIYVYVYVSPPLSLSRCTFLQKTSQHISLHPILFLDTTAGAGRFLLDGLDVALRDAVMRCAPFFMGKKW